MLKFFQGGITHGPAWVLAAAMWAFAPLASAESLPASVRSCTAESDPDRRLACFDKAVAHFPETPPTAATAAVGAGAAAAAHPAQASYAVPDSVNQERPGPAAASKQPPEGSASKKSAHATARVVSIEYLHGEMVLHLDNGQVWEQVQEATADMNLRAGDSVTIDKIMGAYWLGGRSSGVVKVRQKQ